MKGLQHLLLRVSAAAAVVIALTGCAPAPAPVIERSPQHEVVPLEFEKGVVGQLTPGKLNLGDTLTYIYQGEPGRKLLIRNFRNNQSIDPVKITVHSPSGELVGEAVDEMLITFNEAGEYRITISIFSGIQGAFYLYMRDPDNDNEEG